MNGGSNHFAPARMPDSTARGPVSGIETPDAWSAEPEPAVAMPRRGPWMHTALALALVLGWTGFALWAWLVEPGPWPTPREWIGLVATWAAPTGLVALGWLLVMRGSRYQATRFGDVARVLADESARLEQRLLTVNRELSLARDFVAAQARDLEAIGRVSYERVTEVAGQLQAMVTAGSHQMEQVGSVSRTALDNMARLRDDLPVIASAAKDVASQIGNAGRIAHAQLGTMHAGLDRLEAASAANGAQIGQLDAAVEAALGEFNRQCAQLADITEHRFALLAERGAAFRTELDTHEAAALGAVRNRAGALAVELEQLRGRVAGDEEAAFARLRERLARLTDDGARLSRQLDETQGRAVEAWRNAVARLEGDLDEALASLAAAETSAHDAGRARLDTLAQTLAVLDADLSVRRDAQARQGTALAETGETVAERLGDSEQRMAAVAASARALLGDIEASSAATSARAREELAGAVSTLGETVDAVRGRIEALAPATIGPLAQGLAEETAQALDKVMRASAAETSGRLEQAAAHAAGVSREAAHQLREEIAGLDALTTGLEARLAAARDQAALRTDDPFARRAALITETLNAAAIDIAGALATDVADTAWAAYLRGDRGIFTRRAATLLGTGERRQVAALYEADPPFREQVSRYVAEFEAMLREVLSARGGEVLGVTLVSSDLGKLYVALAQAIARLRD